LGSIGGERNVGERKLSQIFNEITHKNTTRKDKKIPKLEQKS
jgi:hypothetical protein